MSKSASSSPTQKNIQLESEEQSQLEYLHDKIIELYLNVKIRNTQEIKNFTDERLDNQKERLKETESQVILGYIRSSVEILMNLKFQQHQHLREQAKLKAKQQFKEQKRLGSISKYEEAAIEGEVLQTESSDSDEPPKDYEVLIQKLEAQVRNHIRVEQQLKLHIESVQFKLEEAEKGKEQFQRQQKELINSLMVSNKRYEEIVSGKAREIDSHKSQTAKQNYRIKQLQQKVALLTKKLVNAPSSNNPTNRNSISQKQQIQDELNIGSKSVDVKTVNTTSKRPSQPVNKNPNTQAQLKTSSGFFAHPNIRSFAQQNSSLAQNNKNKPIRVIPATNDMNRLKNQVNEKTQQIMKLKNQYNKIIRDIQNQKASELSRHHQTSFSSQQSHSMSTSNNNDRSLSRIPVQQSTQNILTDGSFEQQVSASQNLQTQVSPQTITSENISALNNNSYINAPCSGGSGSQLPSSLMNPANVGRSPLRGNITQNLSSSQSNPYIVQYYKKRLDDKNQQLSKLKSKLNKLQNDLRLKHSISKQQIYNPSGPQSQSMIVGSNSNSSMIKNNNNSVLNVSSSCNNKSVGPITGQNIQSMLKNSPIVQKKNSLNQIGTIHRRSVSQTQSFYEQQFSAHNESMNKSINPTPPPPPPLAPQSKAQVESVIQSIQQDSEYTRINSAMSRKLNKRSQSEQGDIDDIQNSSKSLIQPNDSSARPNFEKGQKDFRAMSVDPYKAVRQQQSVFKKPRREVAGRINSNSFSNSSNSNNITLNARKYIKKYASNSITANIKYHQQQQPFTRKSDFLAAKSYSGSNNGVVGNNNNTVMPPPSSATKGHQF